MADFEKLVERLFEKKEKVIGTKELQDLLLQEFKKSIAEDAGGKSIPQISEDEFLKSLPNFQLTEKIGKSGQVGGEARKEFQLMINQVFKSGGNDLKGKINYLKEFLAKEPDANMQISEILSTVMFLKLLSTVVYDFSASGAGFIFEAFLAALLEGEQVTDTQGGSLPIQDIVLRGGRAVSLKLLSTSTSVEGSINNLVKFLGTDTQNNGVDYYVAIKFSGDRLGFYIFNINRENFFQWVRVTHLLEEKKAPAAQAQAPVRKYDFTELINYLVAAAPKTIGRALNPNEYADQDQTQQVTKIKQIFDNAVRSQKNIDNSEVRKNLGLQPNVAIEDVKKQIITNREQLFSDLENKSQSDPLSLRRYDTAAHTKSDVEASRAAAKDRPDQNKLLNWHKNKGLKLPPQEWAKYVLTAMGGEKKQFHIDQREIRRLDPDSFIGDVPLGANVTQVIQKYSSLLEGEIKSVFKNMASLTNSINRLYIGGDVNAAKTASDSAKNIEDSLAKKIEQK